MRLPFTLTMARREARAGTRRLLIYTSAIVFGVAALVAIDSFKANVRSAVSLQARSLLGADLELHSRQAFSADVEAVLDSAEAAGTPIAYMTRFASMALATRSGRTRLLQVRAVSGGYPFYGEIVTQPPGLWTGFRSGRRALVDPAVLIQLDAAVGDSLAIGRSRFEIAGVVESVPGDIGLRAAVGPRVFIPGRYLEETGLIQFGSLARYAAYLKLDGPPAVDRFLKRYGPRLRANQVGYDTVAETERDLSGALERLAGFLGLVGLAALLLGGVGVASGVHVFVNERLDTAAVLRCLGARGRQVFGIYLTLAGVMGLCGATLGVGAGLAVQATLPAVVRDFLPLEIPFRLQPVAILTGLGIGVWVAVLFALPPLLKIRRTSPLRALRRDYEEQPGRFDPWRPAVFAAFAASLTVLSLWQSGRRLHGVFFAAGALATLAVLAGSAFLLMRATRRFFPRSARYVVRQGVANLFRPHNQTMAVSLALGFGVFLIGTLYVVQTNLLDFFRVETRPDRPNLVLFDIQQDQEDGVLKALRVQGAPVVQQAPIVTARLARLNGRSVSDILADSSRRHPGWALRREYRNTYRDTLVESETLVAGRWWSPGDSAPPGSPALISMEEDIAHDLGVGVGDRITWDVAGVPVETRIASLRHVEWARFEPNFFVVFEPGALEDAPQTLVLLTRIKDEGKRARLQRDLVARYPNVSALDLTIIQQALDTVLHDVSLAVRFMALFSIGAGILILIGSLATSRFQRARESTLLRTLGARTQTIRRILATEYIALGALAGVTGTTLAGAAGWALIRFLFHLDFHLPAGGLALLSAGVALLTTTVGLASSRGIVRRTPLAGLREFAE